VSRLAGLHRNVAAFLDSLAVSEIGHELLLDPSTDDGYKVIVGSTPGKPILMTGYLNHPRRLIVLNNRGLKSTAAGRYQLLARYFDTYRSQLRLPDFGPESQDAIAVQQIREQGALADIEAGHVQIAVGKVCDIWASLPGSRYGQHTNSMSSLENAYEAAGGQFA
jgi:muramidase (phage lysozyme)